MRGGYISFFRNLINALYLVPSRVERFRIKYPNENILVAGAAKAVCFEKNRNITCGRHWVTSKRGVLILSDRSLACGKWKVNLAKITNVKALKFSSIFGAGLVLKIETNERKHYQFGLHYDPKWFSQKALPIQVEEGKIEYSKFSVVIRMAIVAYLVWWVFASLNK